MPEITKESLQAKIKQCDDIEALVDGLLNQIKQLLYNRGARDMAASILAELETPEPPKETPEAEQHGESLPLGKASSP